MALRKILTEGDEQLLKHSRKVEKFDDRLHTLIGTVEEVLPKLIKYYKANNK